MTAASAAKVHDASFVGMEGMGAEWGPVWIMINRLGELGFGADKKKAAKAVGFRGLVIAKPLTPIQQASSAGGSLAASLAAFLTALVSAVRASERHVAMDHVSRWLIVEVRRSNGAFVNQNLVGRSGIAQTWLLFDIHVDSRRWAWNVHGRVVSHGVFAKTGGAT